MYNSLPISWSNWKRGQSIIVLLSSLEIVFLLTGELKAATQFSDKIVSQSTLPKELREKQPILIAAPDNFNPGLRQSPAASSPSPSVKPSETPVVRATESPPPAKPAEATTTAAKPRTTVLTQTEETPRPPVLVPPAQPPQPKIESAEERPEDKGFPLIFEGTSNQTQSKNNNSGLINLYTRQTFHTRLRNGDKLDITSGYESYKQRGIDTVNNIPLKFQWLGRRGDIRLSAGVGGDFFNRLRSGYNLNASIGGEVSPGLNLSAVVENGPYKFNAKTLENGITAWRYGPNVFWRIAKDVTLFSSFRWGNYSDSNVENQSFTRIEKKFGQFGVAGNLFVWSYSQDRNADSGYFSPSDFVVYNGELFWGGEIFADFLKCKLSVSLGEQRLEGNPSGAETYQGLCSFKFAPNLEVDFGYGYSTIRSLGGTRNKPTETFKGGLRWAF